ncbi:NADH dehydrogenase ubiquinone Fe-S protein 4 [Mesorhizobium sp. L-8-3]|uniref:NADH dehydrogenase ubiquinone Fe-S protein 4 n=1 Tax=Mesorhizobium sp. L-8-3 TaxID=2744522 RepID=UPI00192850DE|nr:NADH dehydrogenase ubiquinone Fe-S protein 4 [Mesorhizobium sp. L-8-3]
MACRELPPACYPPAQSGATRAPLARIFRPCRSVLTSARVTRRPWLLCFEGRTPPFVEPLMGYTGSSDTLTQVQLQFPTLESAINYAERQGLSFTVRRDVSERRDKAGIPSTMR